MIILWIVFGVCLPFIDNFEMFDSINTFAKRFSLTLPLGYIGYFVLGYELSKINYLCPIKINRLIENKFIRLLFLIAFAMIALNAVLTHFVSVSKGSLTELFYSYLSPTVVLYSACLFLLAKMHFTDNYTLNTRWYSNLIVLMSKYSLAIYMFHEFILIFAQKIGVDPNMVHPLISVPTIAVGIYISSFVVIHVCAKIAFFRNYMM